MTKTLPKYLSQWQVKKLIDTVPNDCPRDKLMIELMYYAGIRVSEVRNLLIDNLERLKDPDATSHRILIEKGKGGKDRYVQIPEPLAKEIETFILDSTIDDPYLFLTQRGEMFKTNWAVEVMVEKCKEALETLSTDHAKVQGALEHLTNRRIAVTAQIETLEALIRKITIS